MSDFEHINPVIELARKQMERQRNNISRIRIEFSAEEFKSLFLIRAQQVLWEHKQIGSFIIDDDNKKVLNLMYYYATHTNQDQINSLAGIILNGAYGCGKSVMISAFCRTLNDIKFCGNETIEEIHALELGDYIRQKGPIAYARKPLLIQDLGKEDKSVNAFGTVINPISNLLAIRAEYGALTFGSTNMVISSNDDRVPSIEKHYRDFISKRLVEHVNLIVLPGKSRRPDYSIDQPK